MGSLQSAAFTFLAPAGCVLRSPGAERLEQFHLRDDAARGGRARRPPVHSRPRRPGGRAPRRRFPTPTPPTAAPRWRRTCRAALAIYADLLRRPHLPAEQLESCRQVVLQDLRAVEDEPAEKVMIELRREPLSASLGPLGAGRASGLGGRLAGRHPPLFPASLHAQRHDPGRGGPRGLGTAGGPGRPIAGRLAAAAGRDHRRAARGPEIPPHRLRLEADADRHRLPQRPLPARRLFPGVGRPWACSAAA